MLDSCKILNWMTTDSRNWVDAKVASTPDSFKLVNASCILHAKAHGPILLAIELLIGDDVADS